MHDLGWVHNDLKLDNFLIGLNDPKIIYLIDFGISSKYLTPEGQHIEKRLFKEFSGNFMFAS
jgi:serine/threonine protein kinase